MLTLIFGLMVYIMLNAVIYRRLSDMFRLSGPNRKVLMLVLLLLGGLLFVAWFLQFITPGDFHFLQYIGMYWTFGLQMLCALMFLEMGLTRAFPGKARRHRAGIVVLYLLFILSRDEFIRYGASWDIYGIFPHLMIRLGIVFLVLFILYRIIVGSLELSDRKRGLLTAFFSGGVVLTFLGVGALFLSLMFGVYAVVYARVTAGFNLGRRGRRGLMVLMGVGFVLSLPQMTFWGNGLGVPVLYHIGGFWLGFFAMAVTVFMLDSGLSLVTSSHLRVRTAAALVLLAAVSGYGLLNGLRVPAVKELEVPLKNLPASADGFSLVQWTDLHLGDLVSQEWLQAVVDKTNALKPDVVVITGDLTDNGFKNKERYITILKKLNAKFGVLAVTGNHEYYWNRHPQFTAITKQSGIRVLENECVTLPNGLQFAGINDSTGEEYGDALPDIKKAVSGADPSKPLILLAHRPGFFNAAVNAGVDLQLSGHTHAGQLPPMTFIARLDYKYFYGLYREGEAYIHTSCGTGLWGVPMRIFSQNEITRIRLVRPSTGVQSSAAAAAR